MTDTEVLRATQAQRDTEARRLNSEAAKRYLTKRATAASTGLIRETLIGVVFITALVIVTVIVLAM
jgi:hypothetical protein